MYKITLKFSVGLMLLLVVSCSNNIVFKEYIEFENLSWNRFNILKFDVPVTEASSEMDVIFSIRHLPEFPYKRMKINMTYFTSSGEMRTNDYILNFEDEQGEKLSECLGDYCDIEIPIRKGIYIAEPGTLKFEIENKMTKLETLGVMEVGLILRKSE